MKKKENLNPKIEAADSTLTESASETIANTDKFNAFTWSKEVANYESEITSRKSAALDISKYSVLPDEKLAEDLYIQLKEMVGEDFNRKIFLYLPFQIFPDNRSNTKMEDAAFFKENWIKLLEIEEPRADYVDGDISESEYVEDRIPKVVKAAHLAPVLISKNIITTDDLLDIFSSAESKVLRESIADTLPTLYDMGHIQTSHLEFLKEKCGSIGISMHNILTNLHPKKEQKETKIFKSVEDIQEMYESELGAISEGIKKIESKTADTRIIWLKNSGLENTISKVSSLVYENIKNGNLNLQIVKSLLVSSDENMTCIGIESLKSLILSNGDGAKTIFDDFKAHIPTLDISSKKIVDTLEKFYYKLHDTGVIDAKEMEELGLYSPEFEAGAEDIKKRFGREIIEVNSLVEIIKSDTELSKYLYPVIAVYGSKIKGYGTKSSDLDFNIFIKEDIDLGMRTELQKLIAEKFGDSVDMQKAMEYWLTRQEGMLKIRDFDKKDIRLGGNDLPAALLKSVWCGDIKDRETLKENILRNIIMDEENVPNSVYRNRILADLERSTLKYRLLHKGYKNVRSDRKHNLTENSSDIDPDSSYWDEGYRIEATKLFLEKVYLPHL